MSQTDEQKALVTKAKDAGWTKLEIAVLQDSFAAPAPAPAPAKPALKDWVGLGITVVFVLAFVIAWIYLFTLIDEVPKVYKVGDDLRVFDPLQQALLAIAVVTPFLTTIIGFYFGQSSGEKAADKSAEVADNAIADKKKTEEDKKQVEKDKKKAEKEKEETNLKVEKVQGAIAGAKAERKKQQQRIRNEAASSMSPRLAAETDQDAIVAMKLDQVLGIGPSKIDTIYLSETADPAEIETYLISFDVELEDDPLWDVVQEAFE